MRMVAFLRAAGVVPVARPSPTNHLPLRRTAIALAPGSTRAMAPTFGAHTLVGHRDIEDDGLVPVLEIYPNQCQATRWAGYGHGIYL